MEDGGSNVRSSYYNVLGIRKDASLSDVRTAYRKLAMKWHPDRYARNPGVAGEAKRRFQQIQEAYSVLNDENKRSMYDAGLYDPHEDDDDDFCDFMQEMISMMNSVKGEWDGVVGSMVRDVKQVDPSRPVPYRSGLISLRVTVGQARAGCGLQKAAPEHFLMLHATLRCLRLLPYITKFT